MTVDYSIVITVQKIIIDEVISACKDTRWGKAPREDGILVDILKDTEKGSSQHINTSIFAMHTQGDAPWIDLNGISNTATRQREPRGTKWLLLSLPCYELYTVLSKILTN